MPTIEDAVSIVVSLLALAVSGVGVYVSYVVAKRYGDVAGAEAALAFEERDAAKARITALRSLLNEVARIRKLTDRNSGLVGEVRTQPVVRMPVAAFETAFVSGSRCLSDSAELLDAVTDYLAGADTINVLIDTYFWFAPAIGTSVVAENVRRHVLLEVRKMSKGISGILDRLERCLEGELEVAKRMLCDGG